MSAQTSTGDASAPPAEAKRLPYTGSCHCGFTKYIVFLTLPPRRLPLGFSPEDRAARSGAQRIYKCNCTVCQKSGLMHVRPASAPDDFLLLAPLDPLQELGDYLCNDRDLHFLFCRTCGGRCLSFMGEFEVVELDLAGLGVGDDVLKRLGAAPAGQKTRVWRPKRENWKENVTSYLSVNGYTLDANQPGLSLVEWSENKWISFCDGLNWTDMLSYERPFEGGSY